MNKDTLKLLAAWLSCLMLIYLLSSCNSIKKAENKVLGNEQSFDKVGRIWAKQNPCINDTVTISKSDTITKKDTLSLSDTVKLNDTIRITTKVKEVVNHYIRDTVKSVVTDGRQVNLLTKDLQQAAINIMDKENQIKQLQDELGDTKDRLRSIMIWFILIVILAIGSHIIRSSKWLKWL